MKMEKQNKVLIGFIAVIYTAVAVLSTLLIIILTKPEQNPTESIKVEIPASIAKEADVSITISPVSYKQKQDRRLSLTKEYFMGLPYYNGHNIDFDKVYSSATKWAKEYEINLNFLLSLIYVESKFENGVVSKANCVGLCQISDVALEQFNNTHWGVKNYTKYDMRWNIDRNIEVACWYLDWLWTYRMSYTKSDVRRYIQSYNYGRTGVKKAIEKNNFEYADAILKYKNALNKII